MWLRHWNLDHDPFDDLRGSFAATSTHTEAVARLVHAIESHGRSASLIAGPGLGKSTVLRRAIEATRNPTRRFARVCSPTDGTELIEAVALGLGARPVLDRSRGSVWRSLNDAVKLCRWQEIQVVIAIDDCQTLESPADRLDLARLESLGPPGRLTVLRVGRPSDSESDPLPGDWGLAIRLRTLTRTEAVGYLAAKLGGAGRADPSFTPRGLTRLHALAEGVPRGLDRLARLALMAAAVRGLEVVPPEVVEEASRECLMAGTGFEAR